MIFQVRLVSDMGPDQTIPSILCLHIFAVGQNILYLRVKIVTFESSKPISTWHFRLSILTLSLNKNLCASAPNYFWIKLCSKIPRNYTLFGTKNIFRIKRKKKKKTLFTGWRTNIRWSSMLQTLLPSRCVTLWNYMRIVLTTPSFRKHKELKQGSNIFFT